MNTKLSLKQILNQMFLIFMISIILMSAIGLYVFWNYLEESQKERISDVEADVYHFLVNEKNNARDSLNVIGTMVSLIYENGYDPKQEKTYSRLMSSTIHFNSITYETYFTFTQKFSKKITGKDGFSFAVQKDLSKFTANQIVSLYDPSMYHTKTRSTPELYSSKEDLWFHLPFKSPNKLVLTDLYYDLNFSKQYVFSVSKTLTNKNGEVYAVVGLDLLAGFLSGKMNDFVFGESGGAFLIQTSSGKIISSPSRNSFFDIANDYQLQNLSEQHGPDWESVLEEREKFKTIYDSKGEAYIVSAYKVDFVPWTIVTYQKRSEFFGPVIKIFVTTIFLVGIVFFLVFFYTRKLQNRIIEAFGNLIEKLSEDAKVISVHKKAKADYQYSELKEVNDVVNQVNTLISAVNENFENYQEELTKNEKIQKELESLVRKRSDQLVASEKMAAIGVMSAGLAHEIKNPLNLIMMSSQIIDIQLKKMDNVPDELKKQINKIQESAEVIGRNGHRADNIIKTLLIQARGQSGFQEFIKIDKLIYTHLDFVKSSFKSKLRKDIKLELDLHPDLPVIKGPTLDYGRAILNILDNAYYALNNKTLLDEKFVPILTISASHSGDWLYLIIRDNGPGIKEENLKHLFTPFYTTKPAGEGTGLGLSMVYEILKNHGAEIEVSSRVGEFTEFIIKFPLYE